MQLEYGLAERAIEDEYVPLGIAHGMGVMVWSPLASGLFSGTYRPSKVALDDAKEQGDGLLKQMSGSSNPAVNKLTPNNWKIVAELERVAGALGRSMARLRLWTLLGFASAYSSAEPFLERPRLDHCLAVPLVICLSQPDRSFPAELRSRIRREPFATLQSRYGFKTLLTRAVRR